MPKKSADLKWQVQMGADEAISDSPNNRFEMFENSKTAKVAPVQVAAPAAEPAKQLTVNNMPKPAIEATPRANINNPSSAAMTTRTMAEKCNNLDELRKAVFEFKDLSIAKTASNTVFADGNSGAEIMLVGEAPGAEEDAQGIPFCGASGQMLGQMLGHIGLSREKNFYITNTIFWRPPGNRRPTPEELAICLPFVEKHIALVKPKLIVLVGGTAIASLLDSKEGITKMRGNFFDYGNRYLDGITKTTAIFHPSYLLRSPGQKRIAWQDLLLLKEYIKTNKIKI